MLLNLSDAEGLDDLPAGILVLHRDQPSVAHHNHLDQAALNTWVTTLGPAADISTAGLYSIAVEYL
jgi:hypothetical protein